MSSLGNLFADAQSALKSLCHRSALQSERTGRLQRLKLAYPSINPLCTDAMSSLSFHNAHRHDRRRFRSLLWLGLAVLLILGGCATRPINPSIKQADPATGYRFDTRPDRGTNKDNLVILAFSGGGTRAAAFSYGVLEFLKNTMATRPDGTTGTLLGEVDVITGVSGGSFTALAYGLYGDKLFDLYEKGFLKRNIQGEIISRVLNPTYWPELSSAGWGRSELAAQLYDEVLFLGATFGDLDRGNGPMILTSATEISTGSRFVFSQRLFDVICSDLDAVPLSRAAAASSAVPVVLSTITLNNYGGTCDRKPPAWIGMFLDTDNPPRPAARMLRSLRAEEDYADSVHRPYLHLVDGGVSDNVAMRTVLDTMETLEALRAAGKKTRLDNTKRIIVIVVNSLSSPKTDWDETERSPGMLNILLKAAGTPIDQYSYEAVELLKDTAAQWRTMALIRNSVAMKTNKDQVIAAALRVPDAEIYTIDVSFPKLKDVAERDYLNQQPTSFTLPDEAVDRLRAAAGTILSESPEFHRLLKDVGASLIPAPGTNAQTTTQK